MPAATTNNWTVAMVRALPDDGNRYEVVDGELLVTPGPTWGHQSMAVELCGLLWTYLREHRVAQVLIAPADVEYDERTMVEPDVFVVPLRDGRRPPDYDEAGALLLVIEILSPPSARADRRVKRRLYQRQGVPEYWIVDTDARLVERWRPGDERPEIITDVIEWRPDSACPPLIIDLPTLFTTACGA